MERPFDLELVSMLVASAMAKAMDVEWAAGATLPEPEAIAATELLGSKLKAAVNDKTVHLSAGFRLAMLVCRRVLADPLHGHGSGVKRDIRAVQRWLQDRQNENNS